MNYLIALSDTNLNLLIECLQAVSAPEGRWAELAGRLAQELSEIEQLTSSDYFISEREWCVPRFCCEVAQGAGSPAPPDSSSPSRR